MAKEQWVFPVGTQREWSGGQRVIKTHDNTIFDDICSAWMNLPTIPQSFLNKFRECDNVGRKIFGYKEPVEGELWLDYQFEKFETSSGKMFTGEQFKQYSKYQKGTYGFQFYTELSKRYLQDKIDLNAKTAEALVEANENKRRAKRAAGEKVEDKGVVLTKEEINEIKKDIKDNFKWDDSQKLTLQDTDDILNKLKEINTFLEKGENFEGDQKELYDKAKILLEEIKKGKYRNIIGVKEDVVAMLDKMNTTFKENWGIRESYRKKLLNALNEYISKYQKNIEEDELENFNKQLGIDLYSPIDEFYKALRTSSLFAPIDVLDKKYIGKYIQSPSSYASKYDDYVLLGVREVEREEDENEARKFNVTYKKLLSKRGEDEEDFDTTTIGEKKLQSIIRAKQTGASSLDIPMKLRFNRLYGKELDGEWDENDLTLLETFEKLTTYLPDGHILTNNQLYKIEKQSYFSGDNSYAHYNNDSRKIFFSSNALKKSDIGLTDLHNGNEIASVLTHEVGHSVSQKLNRRNSMEYRKFVVECGWTWEQFHHVDKKKGIDRSNNFIATGNDPDIKRHGTKADVPLITDYAGKSPEEAFAEYYSFYSQYKHEIDLFLKGDVKSLERHEGFNLIETEKLYGDFLKEKKVVSLHEEDLEQIQSTRLAIKHALQNNDRDLEQHLKTDVVDPYYEKTLDKLREEHVHPSLIITEKTPKNERYSDNYRNPNPVFTVFNSITGKHNIINTDETKDKQIHFANKYLRRLSPTYSISDDCYHYLQSKGYSISQIKDFVLSEVAERKIPKVKEVKENVASTFKGLKYRADVIPASKLQKMSGIFKQMKNIWESDALRKALDEVLGVDSDNVELEKSEDKESGVSLSTIFDTAIKTIKNAIQNGRRKDKQSYADVIIRNEKGEILLLQRSYQDDFQQGKWSLPGGKVEQGESFLQGAERELLEETGIDLKDKLQFVKQIEKKDCVISYFEGTVSNIQSLILDNEEHYRYQFVDWKDLKDYDLIFDLGEYLQDLPLSEMKIEVEQMLSIENLLEVQETLTNDFNGGTIDANEFLKGIKKIKKSAFEFIKGEFEKGNVTTEQFQKAYVSYQKYI